MRALGVSRDSRFFRQKILVWALPHFGILLNSAFGRSGVRTLVRATKTIIVLCNPIKLICFVRALGLAPRTLRVSVECSTN